MKAGREKIDDAIRALWCAYRDATDPPGFELALEDWELWDRVTHHEAVQGRLREAIQAEQGKAKRDDVTDFLDKLPHSNVCGMCGIKKPEYDMNGPAEGIYCGKAWFCSMKCYMTVPSPAACCGHCHNE